MTEFTLIDVQLQFFFTKLIYRLIESFVNFEAAYWQTDGYINRILITNLIMNFSIIFD